MRPSIVQNLSTQRTTLVSVSTRGPNGRRVSRFLVPLPESRKTEWNTLGLQTERRGITFDHSVLVEVALTERVEVALTERIAVEEVVE